MLPHRTLWLSAALFTLGCLLFSHGSTSAGEKKKAGPKAGAALLNKTDELTPDDEKDTFLKTQPRKVYKIKLTEGKTYQIDMKSTDVDSVLRLEDAAGKEVAANDDFEKGSLDSRILYQAPKTAEYKIIATCLNGQLTGRENAGKFTLTVVETSAAGQGAVVSQFTGKIRELKLQADKASYTGELTDQDASVKNHYYKVFTVKLEAGKTYRIDHKNAGDDTEFDPLLFLEDATGKTLDANDDFEPGKSLNSRIVHKAKKSDIYRIICTTLPDKQTGKFTLEINPGTEAEAKEAGIKERVETLADNTPKAECKKLVDDVVDTLRGRNGKLTANDARLALSLGAAVENVDDDLAKRAYKDLSNVFRDSTNPKIAGVVRNFESALKKLALIGTTLEIAGKTVDGKDFDLKNMKGKVVLVDFWATWCGPCIAEMPNVEAAYKKYHGKGFNVIGITLDRDGDEDKLTNFLQKRKTPWNCITIDDSRKIADRYEVDMIPLPVLVDAQGRVVSVRARGPQLERLLEKLLDEKK